MSRQPKNLIIQIFVSVLIVGLLDLAGNAQRPDTGTVRGIVADAAGAVIIKAEVTAVRDGLEYKAETNQSGEFTLNLAPGMYVVRVASRGFALYESAKVNVFTRRSVTLDITLNIAVQETRVTVGKEAPVNTNPEGNASAIVLQGEDLKALPDNAADLEAALQALAGPGAGPNGGEIFIDGFSGGKLPRRDSIREIRINQNPFSSEFDRFGLGRIEIFTKPGSEEWAGEFGCEFEDESFNSRNPFSTNRPPFQLRNVSGELSGPIIKKRLSFFTDFEREEIDNNSLINAVILGPNLVSTPFQQSVVVPVANIDFTQRFDAQLNEKNTLTGRYGYESSKSQNSGLGGFDLPSRAYDARDSEQSIRLTEALVISPAILNELRFQYLRVRSSQTSLNDSPTIRVLDAFTSGGANVGRAFVNQDRFELQNYTSFVLGKHLVKVGGRLRYLKLTDSSPNNFAGTFTFTSLDQYRNTIMNTAEAYPTQFSIAGGSPQAGIKRTDLGLFVLDDWRVNAQLTLSLGLRYETQTNISSPWNMAPRIAFAYAPGAKGNNKPKTVFRGGFGIFYDRFSENLTLQTVRFNGINQQQFIVTDPLILDAIVFTSNGVSNVPTIQTLTAFAQRQTTRMTAPNLNAPYTFQTAISMERQLAYKTTLSVSYVNTRTRRLLRSRNINAPLNGASPMPNAGNIFQYESTGRFDQNQLIFNMRSNFSEAVSIFSNYALGFAKSDSDGAGTFPANSYDLSGEYGKASLDIRHRFALGGSVQVPLGIRFSPFITFRSGVPFNITTGMDANSDVLFTDRPAFATDFSEPGVVVNRFGTFDPTPDAGDTVIPRNYGRGPEFFVVNLRVAKEFGFGGGDKKASKQGPGKGDDDKSKYKLELSVQIRNLLNRTNGGTPVGNLRSTFFGEPVSLPSGFGFGGGSQSGGNRRVRFEVQFSF